jgi:hypothetical protein
MRNSAQGGGYRQPTRGMEGLTAPAPAPAPSAPTFSPNWQNIKHAVGSGSGVAAPRFGQDWAANNIANDRYRRELQDFETGRALDRERYTVGMRSGDSYMRGMDGVDPLNAYDAETRRGALQGLFGSASGSGGADGGGGFNITGPGGPVASLNYNTSINPQQQIGNPQAGAAQIQAPPAHFAGTPGAGSFNNNFAGMAQNAATQFQRGASNNQNAYFNQAQGAQNQNALSGLSQGIRNKAGASNRRNTKMSIAGSIMGGAGT